MINERDIVDNRYEVMKVYASEQLYEVIDVRMRTEWIMKEISITEELPEEIVEKLEQAKKIHHRFFPKVMEIIRQDKNIYIIMEKVGGIHVENMDKKKCSIRKIVNWAIQMCDGLDYMKQCEKVSNCISWKCEVKDFLIDGSSVRVQDFELFIDSPKEEKEAISNIGSFINEMFSEKVPGKLKKIVADCMNAAFTDYQELAEALERYILEQANIKRWKKRGGIAASVVLLMGIVFIVGINARKALTGKKDRKTVELSMVTPSATIETTKQPLKIIATELPLSEKTTESPISPTPIITEKPKEKLSSTEDPTEKTEVRKTNPPVIREKPKAKVKVKPKVKVTVKPRVTKKPESVDIELEDNKMDVIVK